MDRKAIVTLCLTAFVIVLLAEVYGASACSEANLAVKLTVSPIVFTTKWSYRVEVSTDCSCGETELVVLNCEGLKAAMLAENDEDRLRVDEERGLCFVEGGDPISKGSPFVFHYTTNSRLNNFPFGVASARFDC
ncbi:hypothetical protein GOP47_0025798 [Adiantum capillus-veneris]|uniref:Uncharacterized protein n=1 Tax=Adiantum capillus-veneris TaxID=13818 RepID=A0A9D4U0Y9_ADICA|nr:hypothetical protein GOP47_0025798 [Adiantum capillus-veneris]